MQFKSFTVSQFEALFDSDLWPEGVCVRRFWEKGWTLHLVCNLKQFQIMATSLCIVSYSQRLRLTKVNYVQKLCDDCDIVLLQETWLYEAKMF